MKLLLTGATGFVGSALARHLRSNFDYQLKVVLRRKADLPEGIERVCVGDFGPATNWARAVSGTDILVHTAARAHVMRETAEDALAEFRRINTLGTVELARQAAAAGVRRFIFISSIKVNGERTSLGSSFKADDPPAPSDPYGISKLEAESGLRQVAENTGMEVVIVRPPLVYGPNVKGNFLRLLHLVARGIPLPFGNVDNRRSLLNIRNLVDFIVLSAEHPAAAGETFLVSDGADTSTGELVRRLAASIGSQPRLFPLPLLVGRMAAKMLRQERLWERLFGSLQINQDKARNMLGWAPQVPLSDGLDEVGRWYVESARAR